MGLVSKVTGRAEIRSHPIGRVGFSNTVDNDIATLANPEGYDISSVWLNWHKVVRKNGHTVTVNGEALDTFGTAVDKP